MLVPFSSGCAGSHAAAIGRFWTTLGLALLALAPSTQAFLLPRQADGEDAHPPDALPENATPNDFKFQPYLDYDTDSCYNVPAVGPDGSVAIGLPEHYTYTDYCRDREDLDNSNAYSRQRCNSGWCVYFYAYYFEKDVSVEFIAGDGNTGHRHDWEHIALWVEDGSDEAEWVSVSQHNGYEIKHRDDLRWDGTHPKIIYHKEGAITHCFRFANEADDGLENHNNEWIRSPLVSWLGFPEGVRQAMQDEDYGAASLAIDDDTFPRAIVKARPNELTFNEHLDDGSPGDPNPQLEPEPEPEPEEPKTPSLRIMPLGDSITKGSGSSDNNGYRNALRNLLTPITQVDFIGTLAHGTMPDNSHEGHSGQFLGPIKEFATAPIRARPNVVLVHAGTNNMDLMVDLGNAHNILREIVEQLLHGAPDATIIVAKIIWANNPRMQANTDAYNAQIERMVRDFQDDHKHVLLADMSDIITLADLDDLKHPNDSGYRKMARVWFDAIQEAMERKWLDDPVTPEITSGLGLGTGAGSGTIYSCDGGNWEDEGTVFDDEIRTWEEVGEFAPARENGSRDKVTLADLNGDGLVDYVLADNDGTVRAWISNGLGAGFTSIGKINPPWNSVTGGMVRMADVDNDGRADMIIVYSDGAAKVWKNVDNGKSFESLDAQWATGLESGDKVHFKDMDGDGYADYVVVYSGGAVVWARNTHRNGQGLGTNWEEAVTVAPGPAGIPANSVHLYDLDGDEKADYFIIYSGGAVKAMRNTGRLSGGNSGGNWVDWGTIAPGISGVTGNMIRFADIDGDGRADFLAVASDGSIRAWRNLGIVGNKGESLRFADLDGDGRDDIISVNSAGGARAWLNRGLGSWESVGEIAPGPDEDMSAARIEFVDLDGDGLADYVIIYGGGAVKAQLNLGNIPDRNMPRTWGEAFVLSRGLESVQGHNIQFADVSGDGLVDFLVVWDGGSVVSYLNTGNIPPIDGGRIWQEAHTIAPGVGEPGSKIRFADINGDARAEFLVAYDGGAVKSYLNNANIPSAGKSRTWLEMGPIAAGVTPQGMVRLADLNGDGKADYLSVFEDGHVDGYINTCSWTPQG